MIRNPSPDFSLFDQALLSCSDGHCLFDDNGKLLSWSFSFGDFYPKLKDRIKPGYAYVDFVRDLIEFNALQNIKPVDDIDLWVSEHLSSIHEHNREYVHHLDDGRYMQIQNTRLSNGYWFFAATDITVSVLQRESVEDSKRKFESFAKISSDWFWELDKDLRYVYFSTHNTPLGELGKRKLIGVSRIDHVNESALDNPQRREHNAALAERRDVNVVLTWKSADDVDSHVHVQILASPQYDKRGSFTGFLGCAKNVTTEYGLKKQLQFQAAHDELTGLTNRRAFSNYLNASLKSRSAHSGAQDNVAFLHQTLVFVDLDQFKMINDSAGHLAGDQLLVEVTEIFKKVFTNPDDIIARLGGDEFAILSSGDEARAVTQAEELISHIGEYRFQWDERKFSIGASAGIVILDHTSSDESVLLSKADAACYSAKLAGRNQAYVYCAHSAFESNQHDEIGKLELINEALLHDRLSLYLQPIVPTKDTSEIKKFEVLLRLWDANGEMVPPGVVIPVAEKYDRMQHLDLRVVEHSIIAIGKFLEVGEAVALSVNLSGNTLSNESSLNRIANLVETHRVEPGTLCFEVTETAAIKSIEKACRFVERLKQLGCEFSLDDFGSGLSSFSYLRSLQVDYLKIDGCFVTNIIEDKPNRAIVTSFNTLAQELGMKTVAEYVENDDIANLLTELNIDYLQGFGVGKPKCMNEWLELYASQQRLTGT